MTGLEAPVQELHIHKEARSGVCMGSPWYYSRHFPTGTKFSK